LAWADTCLSTAYRSAATTCVHAATHSTAPGAHTATPHAATSTHAPASHAATAGTHMPAAAASTTVVLGPCRAGNCQSERQGRRAQNTEFRHCISPQKVSSKTSALANGSGSEVI
jgi:hypothetical protein